LGISIAIDFDGTIVDHKYPEIGDIKPGAADVIRKLYIAGHDIIIWTCRYLEKDLEAMRNFLYQNSIPYNNINENSFNLKGFWPVKKIYADVYIDDRNIFMEKIDWLRIEKHFVEKGLL
jgi:hypothetical protein